MNKSGRIFVHETLLVLIALIVGSIQFYNAFEEGQILKGWSLVFVTVMLLWMAIRADMYSSLLARRGWRGVRQ